MIAVFKGPNYMIIIVKLEEVIPTLVKIRNCEDVTTILKSIGALIYVFVCVIMHREDCMLGIGIADIETCCMLAFANH